MATQYAWQCWPTESSDDEHRHANDEYGQFCGLSRYHHECIAAKRKFNIDTAAGRQHQYHQQFECIVWQSSVGSISKSTGTQSECIWSGASTATDSSPFGRGGGGRPKSITGAGHAEQRSVADV